MELDFDGDFDDMEAGYGACFEAGITRVLELILMVVLMVRQLVMVPCLEASFTRVLELVWS